MSSLKFNVGVGGPRYGGGTNGPGQAGSTSCADRSTTEGSCPSAAMRCLTFPMHTERTATNGGKQTTD